MTSGTGRVNLSKNPSASVDATGWGGTASPVRVTGLVGHPRTTGLQATAASGYFRQDVAAAAAVTPGQVYSVSVWGESDSTTDLATSYLVWYDSGGADITYYNYGSFGLSAANTPTRKLMENATAPAGAVAVGVIIDTLVLAVISSIQVEPGAVANDYADGDTAGWSWDGTAGLSSSGSPGNIAGDIITNGAIAGNLPGLTSALAGSVTASGVLAGSPPTPSGQLAGTVSATGVLAGSLPGLDGELTADSNVNGVLAGNLPTPTGALAGSLSAAGALAGSLPAPSGALSGSVSATGALSGALPGVVGALTAGSTANGAIAGSLPTPSGALPGTVSWLSVMTGFLPSPSGTLTGGISALGAVSGVLPGFAGSLPATVRNPGVIAGGLPAILGLFQDAIFVPNYQKWELVAYRVSTKEFIKADPIKITLHTRVAARTPTGGVSNTAGSNRPEQTFKLIMQSPAGSSLEQRTEDGTERQVDYILLGEYNAQVDVGDWWEDGNGNVWEVRALVPANGYETRAVVEAHGKSLEGG